jgi:hypothetical protein
VQWLVRLYVVHADDRLLSEQQIMLPLAFVFIGTRGITAFIFVRSSLLIGL